MHINKGKAYGRQGKAPTRLIFAEALLLPIVSYFSAALSCEQRPFFVEARFLSEILLSFVKSDRLNKSKVESGKPAKTRASQGENPIGIGETG